MLMKTCASFTGLNSNNNFNAVNIFSTFLHEPMLSHFTRTFLCEKNLIKAIINIYFSIKSKQISGSIKESEKEKKRNISYLDLYRSLFACRSLFAYIKIRPNKKVCVFRVTLPYLIFLVKPSNFFFLFNLDKNIYAKYWDK